MSTLGNVQVEHMKVEHKVEHRSCTGLARAKTFSALVPRAVSTPVQLKFSREKVVHDLEIARETPRDLIFASAVSPIEAHTQTDKPSRQVNLYQDSADEVMNMTWPNIEPAASSFFSAV